MAEIGQSLECERRFVISAPSFPCETIHLFYICVSRWNDESSPCSAASTIHQRPPPNPCCEHQASSDSRSASAHRPASAYPRPTPYLQRSSVPAPGLRPVPIRGSRMAETLIAASRTCRSSTLRVAVAAAAKMRLCMASSSLSHRDPRRSPSRPTGDPCNRSAPRAPRACGRPPPLRLPRRRSPHRRRARRRPRD